MWLIFAALAGSGAIVRWLTSGVPHAIGNWVLITGVIASVLSFVIRLGQPPASRTATRGIGGTDESTDRDPFELIYERIRLAWREHQGRRASKSP